MWAEREKEELKMQGWGPMPLVNVVHLYCPLNTGSPRVGGGEGGPEYRDSKSGYVVLTSPRLFSMQRKLNLALGGKHGAGAETRVTV